MLIGTALDELERSGQSTAPVTVRSRRNILALLSAFKSAIEIFVERIEEMDNAEQLDDFATTSGGWVKENFPASLPVWIWPV